MNKFKLLLPAILLFLLAGFVSALSVTVDIGNEQTLTGTVVLSASISLASSIVENSTGTNLYYRASSTSAWTEVANNQSQNLTLYTFSWNTASSTDSYSGQVNVTSRNATRAGNNNRNISSAVVNINVDNEAPNLTLTLAKTKTDSDSTVRYTCTINTEGSSNNTNLITMYRPDNSTFTSVQLEDVLRFGSVGQYLVNCQVTDGQGQIRNTDFQTITASSGADNYVIVTPTKTDGSITSIAKDKPKLTAVWIILAVIVVTVVLMMWYFTTQGKKKRR